MFCCNFDFCSLSLCAAKRLVNHNFCIGKRKSLALCTTCKQECSHAGCHANTYSGHITFDILHGIINCHTCGYTATRTVLEKRIAEMEDVARQAYSVSRENERLRQALDLLATHEDYKLVDAYIIGWSSTDWENTLTINRGTTSGIQENMCAITANGEVVGLITDVGLNWAEVTTILDSTLEISGTISASGYNGMVKGGYIDDHETLLKMNYLPSAAIIRNKEQVVTSGSTVYPRGLIMGTIVDAGFAETGIAKYAVLDPAADINSLEQVFIITQYTTEVSTTPAKTEATEPTEGTVATEAIPETFPEGNVG